MADCHPGAVLVPGLVAVTLCISVAAGLAAHAVRSLRGTSQLRRAREHALVSDCLANVDRIIDLTDEAFRRHGELARERTAAGPRPA